MTTISASDFKTRADLENYVRNTMGLTPERKNDYEISGTRAELEALQLSDQTIFWGIICVITDDPSTATTANKVDRGPQQDFGIDRNPNPIPAKKVGNKTSKKKTIKVKKSKKK